MVLSAALMLDDLGLRDSADRVRRAVASACAEDVLTPDVGGRATTDEVAEAIVRGL
jgi:isocitrate/isopropylmalate dehydrogenase